MGTERRVTDLLLELNGGNRDVLDELVPILYQELRAIASRKLRYERRGHTLNTTALVNEAYLKLVQLERIHWQSRAHFLAIAAQAMRRILVDHAVRRKSLKRGGGGANAALAEPPAMSIADADRILALNVALDRLSAKSPRHARIVECRFFTGMTIEETAVALDISPATAKRDWSLVRVWLVRELER
jgi:RNA polymerase sigma factor (TIGR02999 family)